MCVLRLLNLNQDKPLASLRKDLASASFPSCAGELVSVVDLHHPRDTPRFFKGEVSTLGFGRKCPANLPRSHLAQNKTRADGSDDLCHAYTSWAADLGFEAVQEGEAT